jgi:hypothetical protein
MDKDKDKQIEEMVTEVLSKKFEFTTTTTPRETKIMLLRKAVEILENTGAVKELKLSSGRDIIREAFPLAKKLEAILAVGLPDECKEVISNIQTEMTKGIIYEIKYPLLAEHWKQVFTKLRYCAIKDDAKKSLKSLIDSQSNN